MDLKPQSSGGRESESLFNSTISKMAKKQFTPLHIDIPDMLEKGEEWILLEMLTSAEERFKSEENEGWW